MVAESRFTSIRREETMPWYQGDYPPSYKNQPPKLRNKAVEIANALLEEGAEEGVAIATGLKRARAHFSKKPKEKQNLRDGSVPP
jgi:uncharacterized protein YdaT